MTAPTATAPTTAELTVTLNADGTISYVVDLAWNAVPSAEEVRIVLMNKSWGAFRFTSIQLGKKAKYGN